ncbi:MAG TPA: hypothetical protein VFS43_24920 [Polyangiaceae bacterium]|nr:hypothetical protein [Polyangiaceae bacterium]
MSALALSATVAGCQGGGGGDDKVAAEGGEGTIRVAIQAGGSRHDVTAVEFKIVSAGGSCADAPLAQTTSALEGEELPGGVLPPGSGSHAGAGGLFVLPPGDYRVCATPLGAGGPSAACAPTEITATVFAAATTEALLVSQCDGGANGGLDAVVSLNDPPVLTDLDVAPSKFITQCEAATIVAAAQDPDGDGPLSFAWSVLSSPPGSSPSLQVNGPSSSFSTNAPGEYLLEVRAFDVLGGSGALTFPVHVSAADCGGGEGATFSQAFAAGNTTQAACDAWNGFRSQAASGSFGRVTMRGTFDPVGLSCNDAATATQICNALSAGTPTSLFCEGHFWNVGSCGTEVRDGAFIDAIELSVDDPICTCSGPPGHSVRPCIDVAFGNPNWGGVGTETCFAPSQTLEVLCE